MNDIIVIKEYRIRFNTLFNEWQVSHSIIGKCEDFETLEEAELYCKKG